MAEEEEVRGKSINDCLGNRQHDSKSNRHLSSWGFNDQRGRIRQMSRKGEEEGLLGSYAGDPWVKTGSRKSWSTSRLPDKRPPDHVFSRLGPSSLKPNLKSAAHSKYPSTYFPSGKRRLLLKKLANGPGPSTFAKGKRHLRVGCSSNCPNSADLDTKVRLSLPRNFC